MTEQGQFKQHPIRIEDVRVKELSLKGNIHPEAVDDKQEIKYAITVGHSEYDREEKRIVVGLILQIRAGEEGENVPPYHLKIELVAVFSVDENKFQQEHVYDWAKRNAPFILFPYLREQAYALTVRCGYKPLIIPLVEVPTFQPNKAVDAIESNE